MVLRSNQFVATASVVMVVVIQLLLFQTIQSFQPVSKQHYHQPQKHQQHQRVKDMATFGLSSSLPSVFRVTLSTTTTTRLESTTSPTTSQATDSAAADDNDNNNHNNNTNKKKNNNDSDTLQATTKANVSIEDNENNNIGNNNSEVKKSVATPPSSPSTTASSRLSMPWSHRQEWALRDNLPKYTIMVPLTVNRSNNNHNHNKIFGNAMEKTASTTSTTSVFALWRTMLKEVPELTGYPIDFLQERHAEMVQNDLHEKKVATGVDNNNNNNGDETTTITAANSNDKTMAEAELAATVTPAVLPYLEDYEFTTGGGISGKIYGIPGLADGARIETSAVSNIEITLTKGFICTSDGLAAYELGRPKREEFTNLATAATTSSLYDTAMKKSSGSYELLNTVVTNGAKKLSSSSSSSADLEDADGMLIRLGATTGILLAGATAMNMLAHHLTVNVFWV